MSFNKPVWNLRHWIDETKLDYQELSIHSNDKAIDLLLKYPHKKKDICLLFKSESK